MESIEYKTQYDPGFIGPVLDVVARYDAWDRRRRSYAELAAEDLLQGRTEMALMWAKKYAELDERMKAAVKRSVTDTH
jgi:hypothetical protein